MKFMDIDIKTPNTWNRINLLLTTPENCQFQTEEKKGKKYPELYNSGTRRTALAERLADRISFQILDMLAS